MTGERLGVCPIGLHFARIEGDAKRCTKSHALVHPEGMHGGWTTNAFELVTHPIIEGAYRVGGWDAVMHMWFGTKLARYAPFLAARHRTHREARLDYLLLTGRIPRQFRLTDGSADGWIRRAGGKWDRVFFPPLRWVRVDLDGMLRNITINPV